MADYRILTSVRTTRPDLRTLLDTLRLAVSGDVGLQDTLDPQRLTLKKDTLWTGPQVAAAQSAYDAAPAFDSALCAIDVSDAKAMMLTLWECIPAPTMTKAQARTRFVVIRKTLP